MGEAGCGWIAYCDKRKKALLKGMAESVFPRLRRQNRLHK